MIVTWYITEIITVYGVNSNVVTNYSQFGNALKALDVLNVTLIHDDPGAIEQRCAQVLSGTVL
jgi:hypothetical protein